MLILGVDPGSTRAGYGLIKKDKAGLKIVQSGILDIKSENKNERLLDLEKSYSSLLKKSRPDLVAIEKLYFAKNLKTALEVAQSRGVLTLITIKHKIPLLEYTPLEIKQGLTGYGLASKKVVAKIAAQILKVKKIRGYDDVADALAIAIVAANRYRFNKITNNS